MKTTKTYSLQSTLPRLPLPTLEETLNKFQTAVEAVYDNKESIKKTIDDFLQNDGPKLQKLLQEYDLECCEKAGRSYVEEFWNEAYLSPDTSVVLNLNPFFLLEDGPDSKTSKNQIGRASSLTFATCKFASLLKQELITPDYFKGRSLCMDQFKSLFGSCRIPCTSNDYLQVYPESTHVVVLCKNQMYYFQVLCDDDGTTLAVDENDINNILTSIVSDANDDSDKVVEGDSTVIKSDKAIGVLTTLQRHSWAVTREDLLKSSSNNEAALAIVDSALFVLVLDDYTPTNIHDAASNILHGTYALKPHDKELFEYQVGTCINRWYDKLQIIVSKDGSAGVNFEHSGVDGHTALRVASDIFADTVISFAQSITKAVYGVDSAMAMCPSVLHASIRRPVKSADGNKTVDTTPKKLNFFVPATVMDRIFYAETALGDQILSSDTFVLEFKDYGKKRIIKNNLSPDAFVQMSILLAYYRLYGKIVCVYESVLTKNFLHGRTEAMRSATPQATSFCKTFCNPYATKQEKLDALRIATKEHSRLCKEASMGKGIDRHLYALKCIATKIGIPIPSFFTSNAWSALNHSILSTSNCGNPSLRLFGFGPVVPDGFGIGYIIRDYDLQYSVSSKHRQTKRYVNMIQLTLKEMNHLFDVVTTPYEIHKEKASAPQKHESDKLNCMDVFDIFGESDVGLNNNDTTAATPATLPKTDKFLARVKRMDSLPRSLFKEIGEELQMSASKELGK